VWPITCRNDITRCGWAYTAGSGRTPEHQCNGAGRVFHSILAGTPELEDVHGTSSGAPASLTGPVQYDPGSESGTDILVGDTQIILTNDGFATTTGIGQIPFCNDGVSTGSACTDPFTGFDFVFTNENITGVTVDPASAADFQPANGTFQGNTTHDGLQLISANEIRVDVTGDNPLIGDQLILDLRFGGTSPPPPTSAPEPATVAVLGTALVGFSTMRRRRRT
jgi:hypothetical protein